MSKRFDVLCFDCYCSIQAEFIYEGGKRVGATFYGPVLDDFGDNTGDIAPVVLCPGCDMILRPGHVLYGGRLLSVYLAVEYWLD